jgi:hypothetical protein
MVVKYLTKRKNITKRRKHMQKKSKKNMRGGVLGDRKIRGAMVIKKTIKTIEEDIHGNPIIVRNSRNSNNNPLVFDHENPYDQPKPNSKSNSKLKSSSLDNENYPNSDPKGLYSIPNKNKYKK